MTSRTRSDSPYEGPERRAHPRIPASVVPYLTARVAGGPAVRLLDLSKRGVLVETTLHMPPGSTVTVRFVTGNESVTLTGAVVRSARGVLETSGEVTYHTALAFTDELTLCGEELEAAARSSHASHPASRTPHEAAHDYTMIVMDGRTGALLRARADAPC